MDHVWMSKLRDEWLGFEAMWDGKGGEGRGCGLNTESEASLEFQQRAVRVRRPVTPSLSLSDPSQLARARRRNGK